MKAPFFLTLEVYQGFIDFLLTNRFALRKI